MATRVRLSLACLLFLIAPVAAHAQGVLSFSPPATVIEVGAASTPVFAGAPEGYAFLQLSAALPPQCPNVYLHIPFTGSSGSKALYATAQIAFQTGSKVARIIWAIEQGTCVVNHIFLVQ
jgi:hypothetical protein